MSDPQYGERKPLEVPKPTLPAAPKAKISVFEWFWIIALLGVVVAPLSIFLIRLALGAL